VKLRVVKPEILDDLPADDPEAIRSRRDLRLINLLMGNEQWIAQQVERAPAEAIARGVVEIGAGEGTLSTRLQTDHADISVDAYDLAPRPERVHPRIRWHQENVLSARPDADGVLVANLFLHHFEGEAMDQLATLCEQFQFLCFAEPWRHRLGLVQGAILFPVVNAVTRHDMIVSIRAGFRPGELPNLLRLDPDKWRIREQTTSRGGVRVVACRR
jgi:hypothetical protein